MNPSFHNGGIPSNPYSPPTESKIKPPFIPAPKPQEEKVNEIPRLYTDFKLADKIYEVVRIAAYEGEEEGLPCVRVTLTLMEKEKSS